MLPNVVRAYASQGYRFDLGCPSRLFAELIGTDGQRRWFTGGGISSSDAMLFAALSRVMTPKAIFAIGNAFGLSTFVLADLFPEAKVDVIDADVEGEDNQRGSSLTREIAAAHFPNVHLTSGFSPQDIPKAARCDKYQLAFVDGDHNNKQMIADFNGLLPMLDEAAVVIFHDVGVALLFEAWQHITEIARGLGFDAFELRFTQFGNCVLARGLPAVQEYLAAIALPLGDERYHGGVAPHMRSRPNFWVKSAYEVELFLRRTFSSLFFKHKPNH